ncbi:2-oxoacid:acceptor oxidoreductase subunit alpha [Desulfosudis oleivorans]|uniref:2-oxoacid:acceptor oxidoreductase subunit alpha n=1 Tax=Desulfosudis oleivorans TaxID=181663 RepID=UPI0022B71095|nr:2-oxoacid:acceptor oxidoreductase subunit alpha [Desulfosudis oleivorans]
MADDPEALADGNTHRVPITKMAEDAGGKIMANTVAAGACLALLHAPFELFETALAAQFEKAGEAVKAKNLVAVQKGYQAMKDIPFASAFEWQPSPAKGLLMNGARALALGALAANVRLGAFYPMSPATGIMQQLSEISDTYPLVVEQAEDEIAAVNMVIGASFAGVRALTATSGGGFCLMTEGLGLAGITETPLVIINSQRPGPATGLPTRTAQGDLLFVITAAQDEFPRFVFAPRTVGEAYETVIRAFDLADLYQVPVIILTDHYFNDMATVTGDEFQAPETVVRHLVFDADMDDPEKYRRYALTETGISPRALPCAGRALVMVSGNEHAEDGHISEEKTNRVNMVNKRQAKLTAMRGEMRSPEACHAGSQTILVSWGSAFGAVEEAVDQMRSSGHDIGCLSLCDLWPFPHQAFLDAAGKAETVITVEANATAQLGQIIRQQTGLSPNGAILKYDGRPLTAEDIIDGYYEFTGGANG